MFSNRALERFCTACFPSRTLLSRGWSWSESKWSQGLDRGTSRSALGSTEEAAASRARSFTPSATPTHTHLSWMYCCSFLFNPPSTRNKTTERSGSGFREYFCYRLLLQLRDIYYPCSASLTAAEIGNKFQKAKSFRTCNLEKPSTHFFPWKKKTHTHAHNCACV